MIILKKLPSEDNKFDHSHVELKIESGHGYAELVQLFREFSLAIGYHPDTVKEYLDEE